MKVQIYRLILLEYYNKLTVNLVLWIKIKLLLKLMKKMIKLNYSQIKILINKAKKIEKKI